MAIDFPNSPSVNDYFESNGKAWTWNGTSWVIVQTPANLSIASGSISETHLASSAVTHSKIGTGAVTTEKLASSAVTSEKLASGVAATNLGFTPAPLASPTFTGTVALPSTTSIGTVSATEIGYVDGVTSAIQTQLDSKLTATTAFTSNRNAIINGAFNIWQRGTSIPLPLGGGGYVADRWWYYNNGFTSSITQQLCGSTLPQFRNCARIQRTPGQTGTAAMILFSPQETWNSMRFAGKNATVSFYARISSGASRATTMDMSIITGTGTDQSNFGGGAYTGASQIAYINPTLTTSWQRFSVTGAVASTATEIGLQIGFIPTGTAGASDYFEITGIQLEEGSVATPFEFEDYGTTLQKCQRYYQKSYNQETVPGSTGISTGIVTTGVLSMISGYGFAGKTYYPTPMRVSPTVTTYSYGAGTTGVISDAGNGSDKGAGSASVIWQGANGFDVYNLSGTNITSSYGFMYHYTASAEL